MFSLVCLMPLPRNKTPTLWPSFGGLALVVLISAGGLVAQESSLYAAKHWAYQPVRPIAPPAVNNPEWAQHPIDAFIFDNLENEHLSPNPQAEKLILLRRACYDLTGLPPSQKQVNDFLADESPDAWTRLIDQLLDSPHYGEKWGRHWLDAVRWAESNGYERDQDKRNMWKYRDYVIDAINADKPYDTFILEQIAGDVLPDSTPESIIATGFLRLGLYDDEPADLELFYYDHYDDIINTVSRSTLAMSLSCARCHDHKADPISQKDYYRFLAHLRKLAVPSRIRNEDAMSRTVYSTKEQRELDEKIEAVTDQIIKARVKSWEAINRILNREGSRGAEARFFPSNLTYGFTTQAWTESLPDLNRIEFLAQGALGDGTILLARDLTAISKSHITEAAWVMRGRIHIPVGARQNFKATISSGGWMYVGDKLVFAKTGSNQIEENFSIDLTAGDHDLTLVASGARNPIFNLVWVREDGEIPWVKTASWKNMQSRVTNNSDKGLPEGDDLAAAEKAEIAAWKQYAPLQRQLQDALVTAAFNDDELKPTHVLLRGNPGAHGERVYPDFPEILTQTGYFHAVDTEEDPRLTLARWIASKENPLTSRVAVNRIWQHHFGRGLVRSSDEFGKLGQEPTHPRLLDWLAQEFVRNNWKMKPLHRLIMTSKTYRMSSAPNDRALAVDPLNDLFWRYDMRRLTAEEIRDSVLQVAGNLDPQIGGPSVFPTLPEEVLQTASLAEKRWRLDAGPEHQNRRSIYTFVRRSLLDPMMSTFDVADTDVSCPVRFNTTVPAQALAMMNSKFTNDHARLLAERIENSAPGDPSNLVQQGFQLVLGRPPRPVELKNSVDLIESMRQNYGHDLSTALERFSLVMLNLNEFIFLD